MANVARDENRIPTIAAVSNTDSTVVVPLYADPTTHRLLVSTSGSTTPGGADTQVQFNDGGTLSGDAGFTYNKTTDTATLAGDAKVDRVGMEDTDSSHYLYIEPGSNLTADRVLTVTTGDANRTLTISASATVSQDYSSTGNPQFATIELGNASDTTLSRSAGGTLAVEGVDVVTVSGTQTLSNKTLTAPKIVNAGFIADANGNEQIIFNTTASAVNEIAVTNAATGTTGPLIAASGETNVDLRLAGKGTGKIHDTTGRYGDITADSDGATITFNMATSNIHTVTLGGARTLALSNVGVGQVFILRLLQDGTGSRTVTWFTTIKWAGGAAPTLTTTANKADMFGFLCTSSGNYDGFVIGQNL